MLAFVYGTLTDPDQAAAVVDEFAYEGPATLRGLHAVEGRYPTLAPGGETTGRLLRTDDVASLDDYEGVDAGLYVRVAVPVVGADDEAAAYVGDPDRLGANASWPGDGQFADRVKRYLADHEVVVDPD